MKEQFHGWDTESQKRVYGIASNITRCHDDVISNKMFTSQYSQTAIRNEHIMYQFLEYVYGNA